MKTTCPFCDSENVQKVEIEENFVVPFCGNATIRHETFRCNDCEEEGDFNNTLDKALTKAINAANFSSASKILDSLAQSGISMTYLEKALRLPFRTTARWKRGKISHSALALLRIIRFSPSLLEVADDNFSHYAEVKYQFLQPVDVFQKHTSNVEVTWTVNSQNNNRIGVSYSGDFDIKTIPPVNQRLQWELAK